jgi:hypothetical protein
MSKLEVNAVEPQCGTNLTLGASGDTIIIPSGATISNQGTAAGFGPTGAVSWDTTKITADPNPAVSGVGYFADTTSAAFTITLPSSPSAGAVVGIADYANTFATNNLTVDRNGSNIGGDAENATLFTNGVSVTFVYVDATQGWIVTDSGNRADLPTPEYIVATGGTITCDGDYKIHTFTGPGTFTVCSVGNPIGSSTVDYLVVAGGGAGGSPGNDGYESGGGGAGGLRIASSFPVSVTAFPITVGAGGAGSPTGNNGSNSVFSTITSTGGGKGAPGGVPGLTGFNGGSGGGAGQGPGGIAGAGNTPPVSPPQGNPGSVSPIGGRGGGGGGSGTTGTPAGVGGSGTDVTPTFGAAPQPFYIADGPNAGPSSGGIFAGGGGGSQPGQAGGPGGGANGSPNATGIAGIANTGGGGGGITTPFPPGGSGGSGGSGIVLIRYKYQ